MVFSKVFTEDAESPPFFQSFIHLIFPGADLSVYRARVGVPNVTSCLPAERAIGRRASTYCLERWFSTVPPRGHGSISRDIGILTSWGGPEGSNYCHLVDKSQEMHRKAPPTNKELLSPIWLRSPAIDSFCVEAPWFMMSLEHMLVSAMQKTPNQGWQRIPKGHLLQESQETAQSFPSHLMSHFLLSVFLPVSHCLSLVLHSLLSLCSQKATSGECFTV